MDISHMPEADIAARYAKPVVRFVGQIDVINGRRIPALDPDDAKWADAMRLQCPS